MTHPEVDVAVIGAGLAGLTAANALKPLEVVVLEREARAGGRVLTRTHRDIAYDLGAVFAVDLAAAEVPIETPALRAEAAPIGLFFDSRLVLGASAAECLGQLDLDAAERASLERFTADPAVAPASALPARLYRALNSFFRLIHPGEMKDYVRQRQGDALVRFDTRHWATGNRHLVDALAAPLGSRLKLGAEVVSISDAGDHVTVTWLDAGAPRVLTARAAICAVPGPAAGRLLRTPSNPRCAAFLETARWVEGTVVVTALPKTEAPAFSYIVTPELPFNGVIKHTGQGDEPDVFLTYYVGASSRVLMELDGGQQIARTLEGLRRLGIWHGDPVVFSDVHRWSAVGPVIDERTYGSWSGTEIEASDRVFLAGDYTCVDGGQVLPFGTTQAMISGERAARLVRGRLAASTPLRPRLSPPRQPHDSSS